MAKSDDRVSNYTELIQSQNTVRSKKTVSKAPKTPKKVETRLPIRLFLEEGSTRLKNLNVFSELPLASLTVENVRKRYVISELIDQQYQRNITVTMLPPTQGFDEISAGLPTINDTDVIKFCISLLQRKCLKEKISLTEDMRTVTFTFRDFINFTGSTVGGSGLLELKASLARLKGSVIEISSEWVNPPPAEDTKNPQSIYNSGQFSFLDDFMISSDASPSQLRASNCTTISITLNRMIWRNFMDPRNLINYNRYFFKLSAFKKSLYEKVVKAMGKKQFYRIRLIKLATRMGAVDGAWLDGLNEENFTIDNSGMDESLAKQKELEQKLAQALRRFKGSLREAIADDDLLEFKIAIEQTRKSLGDEVVVFYRRDYKLRLSNQVRAVTEEKITLLDLALQKQRLEHWFYHNLLHAEEMRECLEKNARWMKRHQYDLEAIKIGNGLLNRPWRRGQKNRYELLMYLKDIEFGKFIQEEDAYSYSYEEEFVD